MNSNIITCCIYFIDISYNLYWRIKMKSAVNWQIWIISNHFHSKINSSVCDFSANCSQTNNTQSLAKDFRTCKFRLTAFNCLWSVRSTLKRCSPRSSFGNFSWRQKQRTYSKFLNCVSISSRTIKNNYTGFSALIYRNIVYPCTCSCNCKKIWTKFHIVHLSRTNHYCIRIWNFFPYCVLAAVKLISTDSGNFI